MRSELAKRPNHIEELKKENEVRNYEVSYKVTTPIVVLCSYNYYITKNIVNSNIYNQ